MKSTRRNFLGAALSLACLPRLAGAGEAESAATGPAQWLERWLAAFNAARASEYVEFVRAHIPSVVPYLDDDLGVREASGGFVLLGSEASAPRQITARVRDRRWERFSRVVLTVGEGRIEDLSFLGAPPPADFHVPRLRERDALAALRRTLRSEADAGRFSGAVLVGRGDEVLFREAYGNHSLAPAREATPSTRFCIGSMGKMFTAVAALQLVQESRLRLTDTVAALLPAYPDTPLARRCTVEHLLTHTGGTGDFFGPDYEAHRDALRTPSDFVRHFGRREAAFEPGSRWGYSNFGFMLLGAIVEQVSGAAWDEYMEARVFRVAGMRATSTLASDGVSAEPCTGAAETGLKSLPFYVGLPAGGGYSTLDDLHRFAVALRGLRLLDAAHFELLTRARTAAGSGEWSLGLRVAKRNGAACYGHGGSAPGINADFAVYPDSGYHTVVLANRGHPHAAVVAEYIGARLPRAEGAQPGV